MAKGYNQKQAVMILYGISATLGMFAIILLESGIWKAISFALMVVAIIAIGYKDMFNIKKENEEKNTYPDIKRKTRDASKAIGSRNSF